MKTSEFIEKVEKLEFVERVDWTCGRGLFVKDEYGEIIAYASPERIGAIDTACREFGNLEKYQKIKLLNLLTEYASTPIEQRKDKTIEEKAKEYIQEYASDHLSFESARDFLECCHLYFNDEDKNRKYLIDAHLSNYSQERLKECSEIYDWYHENSTEFIKMWLEVSGCE